MKNVTKKEPMFTNNEHIIKDSYSVTHTVTDLVMKSSPEPLVNNAWLSKSSNKLLKGGVQGKIMLHNVIIMNMVILKKMLLFSWTCPLTDGIDMEQDADLSSGRGPSGSSLSSLFFTLSCDKGSSIFIKGMMG
ncbi:unnamed protein product [Caretta caretta]